MRLLIFKMLFLSAQILFSQDQQTLIKEIRAKYSTIREHLASYDTTTIEITDESTEGGQATGYYDKSDLKMIEATWFGETGKRITEYYFDNGKIFFAFDRMFTYNRPMYWDEETARANGDKEAYDPKKTKVNEDRYYFNQDKLFLWMDHDKKEVDLTKAENVSAGKEIIEHGYEIGKVMRK